MTTEQKSKLLNSLILSATSLRVINPEFNVNSTDQAIYDMAVNRLIEAINTLMNNDK